MVDVRAVKFWLLLLTFILAIFFCEICIRYIVGFPDYGVEKYIIGLDP